ncbi:MAG: hypothetical protein HYU41_00720 [Candidatus Rokubacteria bacterium]|nr:hypothetical protein [Candidatus Rokubacteria bacterium]
MQDNGIDRIVATCAGTSEIGDDRAVRDALVRCAAAITTAGVDCPLGALVVDRDAISWSRGIGRLVAQGARGIEPVFRAAIGDCAAHGRLGEACPLARARLTCDLVTGE